MDNPTTVARLTCDETTARRLATYLGESLNAEDTACAAFEDDSGQWQIAIHFRLPPDEESVRDLVRLAAGEAAARALTLASVAAADWVAQSLQGLKPVPAGRVVVHGAHDRGRVPPNALGIEIEAALAFGTGHHGTTRGCLLALDDLAKRWRRHPAVRAKRAWKDDGSRRRVLDVGTGSGVLAFAAAKALRTHVLASDIDPLAVHVARDNARLNRVAPLITFVTAAGVSRRALTAPGPYDLIFANILLGPLTRMARALARLAAPGARVVLSGLLPSHANAVLAAYRTQGLVLEKRFPLDGWMTLVLRKPA